MADRYHNYKAGSSRPVKRKLSDDEQDEGNGDSFTPQRPSSPAGENTGAALSSDSKCLQKSSASISRSVAQHYNRLQEKGLSERRKSPIVCLRNFNNWIKSMLIREFVERLADESAGSYTRPTVLDLGCGKGGDLLKWRKADIGHLICVDIADQSVQQCRERYNDMRRREERSSHWRRSAKDALFSAQFLVADCTRDCLKDLLSGPAASSENEWPDRTECCVDLVSMQFALHYGFESLGQAECLLDNICAQLRVGGYFIATLPDANTIVRRADSSSDKCSFGNSLYRIQFDEPLRLKDCAPALFGARYHFYLEGVVDCPEFLVYRPLLERMCEIRGLRLVFVKNFSEMFADYGGDGGAGAALLRRMPALETYSSESHLSDHQSDYQHAAAFLKSDSSSCIGTMSLCEWQACTIYIALAFQKVREVT